MIISNIQTVYFKQQTVTFISHSVIKSNSKIIYLQYNTNMQIKCKSDNQIHKLWEYFSALKHNNTKLALKQNNVYELLYTFHILVNTVHWCTDIAYVWENVKLNTEIHCHFDYTLRIEWINWLFYWIQLDSILVFMVFFQNRFS